MSTFKLYSIVRLEPTSDLSKFKCSDEDLNDFLWNEAKNYQSEMLAVTYLLIDPETGNIAAYYSLLTDQIRFSSEENSIRNRINRKIPHSKQRNHYPAIKIGRLAVSIAYEHQGVGRYAIRFIRQTIKERFPIGCRFLTVDAYANAIGFYENCGFHFFTQTDEGEATRLMYCDVKTYL